MNLSPQSIAAVQAFLTKALEKYAVKESTPVITDIYLQPQLAKGELMVLNDDDEVLAKTVVKEWENPVYEDFYVGAEASLRQVLAGMQQADTLNSLCLLKPYSFVLVDEDKETLAELLLVDDAETLFLSDELLKGLDEELNAFLKDLLEK